MKNPAKRKRSTTPAPPKRPQAMRAGALAPDDPQAGYSLPQMVQDLRQYQRELEVQNKALRFSQLAAEGASERFLTLFSNVPLALMVVDENGLILESNAMALRLFRPTERDAPLTFFQPLVNPAHANTVTQTFALAKAARTSQAQEVLFNAGSNGEFTGDLHIARIENPQDELAHFICALIDQGPLIEQRQALQHSAQALQQRNQALNQSQARLAAVINSSLDAIICVDSAQLITVFNPAAAALFQCPPEQALGSALVRFLPQAAQALAHTEIATHAQLGETEGRTAVGRLLAVEISVSREHQPEGDVSTVFARDLTARKRIEAQRNVLESQLRESHKMQAIGTMAGGIAHDFNNIIGAILGNAALAKLDCDADSPACVSLTEIEKAGKRARDLVRQILTFSRNEAPRRQPIQLADAVHETARLLRIALPPNVEISTLIEPDTPLVLADITQIEQALLNLCTNGIHAIGSSRGTVSIELGRTPAVPEQVERRGSHRGDYVTLAVRDSGSGMTEETLQRVFEPFFTTKPVGQGTGLGLAVVHGIMRSHQGTVGVRSKLGRGSVFTLYFPQAAEQARVQSVEPVRVSPPRGGGQHIMYVDDDRALVFLMERALTRRGFKVSTFTEPREALAALQSDPQTFDLLVTDYNMPGYSGLELLRDVRGVRADLPVALSSGYVTAEIEASALAEGARALLHKPNDVEELCETIALLLKPDAAAGAAPS